MGCGWAEWQIVPTLHNGCYILTVYTYHVTRYRRPPNYQRKFKTNAARCVLHNSLAALERRPLPWLNSEQQDGQTQDAKHPCNTPKTDGSQPRDHETMSQGFHRQMAL